MDIKKIWQKISKSWPSFAALFVIGGICTYLLVHHEIKGNGEDLISRLEAKLLDLKFVLRGKLKTSGQVGILALDEKSIQRFGRWPFDRKYYEQAFANLKKQSVAWVAFDATFSEPQKSMLEDAKPLIEQLKNSKNSQAWSNLNSLYSSSIDDQKLAQGIKDFHHMVLGYLYFNSEEEAKPLGDKRFKAMQGMEGSAIEAIGLPDGRELKDYKSLGVTGVVGNIPSITSAGKHFAFFNNEPEADAVIRFVTLVRTIDGNLMPSLSLKTTAEALQRQILVEFDNIGVHSISLVSPEDQSEVKIPVDNMGRGRMILNHRGPGMTFPHFSLADAYDNSFTEAEIKKLKNMVLVMGPTASGINDQRPNPFDPAINGVENHAAAIDNMLVGDFMKRPTSMFTTELYLVLSIALIFGPVIIFSKAWVSGVLALLMMVGFYYFDQRFWFSRGIWSYMGIPYIEMGSLFVSITLIKYMTEEREKKKVKGAFQHYLSPEVINQVLDDPQGLKLGGERRELTIFFSDVRGFTTLSESLSPEDLCQLMNEYFTPMTGLILKSRGVLDKYIGDAIMAFWGAPVTLPDQVDQACLVSLAMLYELDRLQQIFLEKYKMLVDIGIGLNTGAVSVGNMGSNERFCYTVMGDHVNLASRLEGITKKYGVKIVISEYTRAKITRSDIFLRDLDDIRVKGKNEPVKIFELMRPDYVKNNHNAIKDLIGEFNQARLAYRAQDWTTAERHLHNCEKIHPEDGPSHKMLDRIAQLKNTPKIENWDGVHTFDEK